MAISLRFMAVAVLTFGLWGADVVAQNTTAPMGSIPALKVDAVVGIKQRNRSGSFYEKTMDIEPKCTIEGVTRAAAIPALDAIMVIVTMDTGAKYSDAKNVFTVHTAQTLPIIQAADGTKRAFEFEKSTVVFDTARDSSNVGGQVYKYYVFGLRDPATKQIVDFQTNFASLATFCKAHPEKRAEFLGMTKGATFPSGFR
jgi:hypothetical protein